MQTITFTPEMAYKDLLISNENKMATIKNALNTFIEVSSCIKTIDKDSIIKHINDKDKELMMEVLAIIHLLNNEKAIKEQKDCFIREEQSIKLELIKIDKSLLIECDKQVLKALEQTRHKWFLKLLKKRNDIEIATKILEILTLINHTTHANNKRHLDRQSKRG